jgi:murein DD-endopeptidase MepM/ murein hydrolase activator NlpD
MATPYDGKIGLWHVAGSWVGEATIDALIQNIKTYCPVADAVWVKTSNDVRWQGAIDTKAAMEINGPADITNWANKLAAAGLELHTWCVVTGGDVAGEAAKIIDACKAPGVKSMVIDVEPHDGYWKGTPAQINQLMNTVRTALGPRFHIGISVDPRSPYYSKIYPDSWRPYVNSVHPQVYWELMGRTPEDVLNETYLVWGNYGLPIIPALQGWATPSSIKRAQDIARGVRGAPGVSYFRLGVIGASQFPAINQEFVGQEIGPDQVVRTYANEQIIAPGGAGYADGTRTGVPSSAVFKQYASARGHLIKYKSTAPSNDTVWAQWNPKLPAKGLYEISVYIPGRHGTTTNAKYHIHGISGGGSELLVRMNQSLYTNVWVPLVVYEFDGSAKAGQVNLTDLTGETNKEIAFTAIRWRQVMDQHAVTQPAAAGFDPPVGTPSERLSSKVWPGQWYDSTGFASFYTTVGPAYHTGADLNLPNDADKGTGVYAVAPGVVTYSGKSSGTWGQLIVIRHDPLADNTVVWTRSAHLQTRMVKEGDRVERGQQIAEVGNAEGQLQYHLHFDIATTSIMESNPGHWPGNNQDAVLQNYTDPLQFIKNHRPPGRA